MSAIKNPTNAIVGKAYSVPCVRGKFTNLRFDGWVPVIGPVHEDKEYIGLALMHHHIDWRFVLEHQWKRQTTFRPADEALGSILYEKDITEGPKYLRRPCLREMPTFPTVLTPASTPIVFLPELEKAFADVRLSACRTCPHRGIPLDAMKANANGVVVCPGHGLAWDTRSGRLVRRTQSDVTGGKR